MFFLIKEIVEEFWIRQLSPLAQQCEGLELDSLQMENLLWFSEVNEDAEIASNLLFICKFLFPEHRFDDIKENYEPMVQVERILKQMPKEDHSAKPMEILLARFIKKIVLVICESKFRWKSKHIMFTRIAVKILTPYPESRAMELTRVKILNRLNYDGNALYISDLADSIQREAGNRLPENKNTLHDMASKIHIDFNSNEYKPVFVSLFTWIKRGKSIAEPKIQQTLNKNKDPNGKLLVPIINKIYELVPTSSITRLEMLLYALLSLKCSSNKARQRYMLLMDALEMLNLRNISKEYFNHLAEGFEKLIKNPEMSPEAIYRLFPNNDSTVAP